jgi:hypothetical protein
MDAPVDASRMTDMTAHHGAEWLEKNCPQMATRSTGSIKAHPNFFTLAIRHS